MKHYSETTQKNLWMIFGILVTMLLLIPVYLIFIYSFETMQDMFHMPPYLFPPNFTFDPIIQVFTDLRPYIMNSIINAVGCLVVTLLTAPFAAYGLAVFNLRAEKPLILILTLTQMFPVVMIAIPLFLMYSNVGLTNSYIGLILANATYTIPFCTLILTSYMRSVPFEIIEAALIDGASPLITFLRVVAPMVKSGIATSAIFGFLFPWADFVYALVIATQDTIQPMSVGLYRYVERYGLQWNNLMAGGLIFSIPALVVVIATGKFIIGGLTAGSVKQ